MNEIDHNPDGDRPKLNPWGDAPEHNPPDEFHIFAARRNNRRGDMPNLNPDFIDEEIDRIYASNTALSPDA